jgi:hypothetical protein
MKSIQLLCTEPVAKGDSYNVRAGYLSTARFVKLLNADSSFQLLAHRRSGTH